LFNVSCITTFLSPLTFAFVLLHSHHLWPFAVVFLHFHHHLLLHLCFYIFITLYLLHVFLHFHPNPLPFCISALLSLSTIKFKGTGVCYYVFRVLMFSKALVCVIKHLRWSILLQLVSCILIAQVLILGSNVKAMWFSSCLCFLGLW
jgi:hypothetical protein